MWTNLGFFFWLQLRVWDGGTNKVRSKYYNETNHENNKNNEKEWEEKIIVERGRWYNKWVSVFGSFRVQEVFTILHIFVFLFFFVGFNAFPIIFSRGSFFARFEYFTCALQIKRISLKFEIDEELTNFTRVTKRECY